MGNNTYRAKQFMPFASLKGYYNIINETKKLKEEKRNLSDYESNILSSKLNQIKKGMIIKVRYYDIDAYTDIEGIVSSIDSNFKTLTIIKTVINFEDILELSGKEIKEINSDY